jgi:hypothetical protein
MAAAERGRALQRSKEAALRRAKEQYKAAAAESSAKRTTAANKLLAERAQKEREAREREVEEGDRLRAAHGAGWKAVASQPTVAQKESGTSFLSWLP